MSYCPDCRPATATDGSGGRFEDEVLDVDLAGVPEGGVLHERRLRAGHVGLEHERARADRLGGQLGGVLRGGGADDLAGLARQQQRDLVVHLGEVQGHVGVAVGGDALDGDQLRRDRRVLGGLAAFQARLDGGGVELGAVGEGQSRAQVEGDRAAVLGVRPRLGEPRLCLALLVHLGDALVDEGQGVDVVADGRGDRVPGGRQ
ncbi:hypothetical protein GCM10020001_107640 [Nonomuraea salmonea]